MAVAVAVAVAVAAVVVVVVVTLLQLHHSQWCILSAGLDLVLSDWEEYYQDGKQVSNHSRLVRETIINHCKIYSEVAETCVPPIVPRSASISRERLEPYSKRNAEEDRSGVDCASSTSATEESDLFTSVSSLTSEDSANTVLSDGLEGVRESSETFSFSLADNHSVKPLNSEGVNLVTSDVALTLVRGKSKAGSLLSSVEALPSLDAFELFLLILSLLENLTSSQYSLHDPSLLMHSSGQLINVLLSWSNTKSKTANFAETEVCCEWNTSASTAAQLMTLRTVFSVLYTACRDAKSAKQLSRSSYITKLLEVVQNSLGKESFAQENLETLMETLMLAVGKAEKEGERLSEDAQWLEFHHILFFACSLQGLATFLLSSLHYGTLVNSSLLMLSQELYDQFASSTGFDLALILALKLEEVLSGSTPKRITSEECGTISSRLESFPKNAISRILGSVAKAVFLLKKGKSHCRISVEHGRKKIVPSGVPSIYRTQDAESDIYTLSSDVGESSESAADMEAENERRTMESGEVWFDQVLFRIYNKKRRSETLVTITIQI